MSCTAMGKRRSRYGLSGKWPKSAISRSPRAEGKALRATASRETVSKVSEIRSKGLTENNAGGLGHLSSCRCNCSQLES